MMNIGRKQIIYGAEIKGIPKRCINFSSKILYINFIMDFARNHKRTVLSFKTWYNIKNNRCQRTAEGDVR